MVRRWTRYSPFCCEKSTSKWHRRDASIFGALDLDTTEADSDGCIDESCEGESDGDRCTGGVSALLGGTSLSAG
jgi:hypothetical protein